MASLTRLFLASARVVRHFAGLVYRFFDTTWSKPALGFRTVILIHQIDVLILHRFRAPGIEVFDDLLVLRQGPAVARCVQEYVDPLPGVEDCPDPFCRGVNIFGSSQESVHHFWLRELPEAMV